VSEDYGRMTTPVLIWGGWADNYMNTVAHLVENVPAPCKGIVGPWVHQYPHTAVPGPRVGFLQEAIRWWDRWLKGIENGAENDPAYRAYMLHSAPPDASAAERAGHWVAEPVWPSPRVSRRELHLGDRSLGVAPAVLAVQVNTPQHLGLHAGEFFPMGLNAEMPGDQRSDDAMSVCFDTVPLAGPMDLMGAAELRLTLSSDQPLAFVVARLCDVGPDGSSVRIAHGMLNLCHRDSMETPAPMVPGQATEVAFCIDQMSYRLAPGHRLRLALSTTYWPFVWPSPVPATLTVTHGTLDLPVHDGSRSEWTPPPAHGAPTWKNRVLRPAQARRVIETDMITGKIALVVEDAPGEFENLTHGLFSAEAMSERWEIDPADPLAARAVHVWEQRLWRDDWAVRTRAEAEMTATATHLRMTARLTAWQGTEKLFEKDYVDEVPRRFV
jgi:predicted acyl esterase